MIDRICRLTGEAVLKLNKECHVIISLYDESINAVRIKVATGLESITGSLVEIPDLNPEDIFFEPKELKLRVHVLKSGKLEYFEGGLYALLAKKVPYDLCNKIEQKVNTGSILISGFFDEKRIFGTIFILVPEGKKFRVFPL